MGNPHCCTQLVGNEGVAPLTYQCHIKEGLLTKFASVRDAAAKLNPLEEELQTACVARKVAPLGAIENLVDRWLVFINPLLLDARPFCRALMAGFAGLRFLGFLLPKQPLPKRGPRWRPGSVNVSPSHPGPEGSRREGAGRVILRAAGPGAPLQPLAAPLLNIVGGHRPAVLLQHRRVIQGLGGAGGGRREHHRPRSRVIAVPRDGRRFDGRFR